MDGRTEGKSETERAAMVSFIIRKEKKSFGLFFDGIFQSHFDLSDRQRMEKIVWFPPHLNPLRAGRI